MVIPRRIQRKRTKGWRMPASAVYVGRPTKWANPYRVGDTYTVDSLAQALGLKSIVRDAMHAVALFRERMDPELFAEGNAKLRGKDLVCWCAADKVCHADAWLEIANPSPWELARREYCESYVQLLARHRDREWCSAVCEAARARDIVGIHAAMAGVHPDDLRNVGVLLAKDLPEMARN